MVVLTKKELLRQMKKFAEDKDRGISIPLFCELAGIHKEHFRDVFIRQCEPLTEYIQMRVNKAYTQWKAGNVKVMRRRDLTRYVEYRKTPEPPMMAGMGLKVTSDGIKIKVGMVNRHDYSETDLNEALRG